MPPTAPNHPLRSWKLVAGAYLHFVAPAYLVAIPVAALATAPPGATTATLLRLALGYSGWFLLAYTALALLSVAAIMALEPAFRSSNARREARDPRVAARASERRVTRAVVDGRRQLGTDAVRILDAIQGERWHHDDPRDQALSADLAEVVRTSIAAIRTAPLARRDEIAALSAGSLGRIDQALAQLHAERGRLDEGDARTVARYLELRYGSADSAGEAL